jgi:large-conductance mechanosensitive channel
MVLHHLTDFVIKNSVLLGITVVVIATFVNELVISFINDIILPVIERDGNNDNEPDINRLKHIIYKTNGITFKIGSFLISLIKFCILMVILFFISIFILKLK